MTNIEPHHYVVGGSGHSKFTAQPHKCNSKIQNSKTFFETVKRHQLHISDRKQAQQLGNTDEGLRVLGGELSELDGGGGELRLLVEAVRRCCCTELYREPTFPFLSFNKAKQTKRDVFKSFFCLCFVSLLFFSFSLSDTERERRYRKWTSFV